VTEDARPREGAAYGRVDEMRLSARRGGAILVEWLTSASMAKQTLLSERACNRRRGDRRLGNDVTRLARPTRHRAREPLYERRAAAYVEAIDTFERHIKTLANIDWTHAFKPTDEGPDASWRLPYEDVRVDDETDVARIRSRPVAFGSTEAIAALDRVGALDKKAFALVLADTQPTGQTDLHAWKANASQAISNLRDGITEFETRLNRELTS
jgi:hypothetical protein